MRSHGHTQNACGTRIGRLDYAVANAGLLRRAPLLEMTDALWDEMLNVDLTGVMRTFRAATRHMNEGGALVAISSIAGGVYGWQEHSHYAAAKAGVPGLCRSLAVELAPLGIRCNAVIPGLIETPQSLDAKNSLGPEGLAACGALLDYVESDPELFDADRLAFREVLRQWQATMARDGTLPAIKLHKRIGEDLDALAEIERNYEKEIREVFGRFESRGITLKRERWDDYVAQLQRLRLQHRAGHGQNQFAHVVQQAQQKGFTGVQRSDPGQFSR